MLDAEGRAVQSGSGFLVRRDDSFYLITNAHILSGRTADNQRMPGVESFPSFARITFPGPGRMALDESFEVTVPMFDETNRANWLQHPHEGRAIDVVALPLSIETQLGTFEIETDGQARTGEPDSGGKTRARVRTSVGQHVFVVGYPLNLNGGAPNLSIWVGATIATEPAINHDGKPRFMIDGATRRGLSGAPVYAHWPIGVGVPFDDPEFDLGTAIFTGPTTVLLGVYSGRISEDSDLGFVWKSKLISEIIDGGVRGNPVGDVIGKPTGAHSEDDDPETQF